MLHFLTINALRFSLPFPIEFIVLGVEVMPPGCDRLDAYKVIAYSPRLKVNIITNHYTQTNPLSSWLVVRKLSRLQSYNAVQFDQVYQFYVSPYISPFVSVRIQVMFSLPDHHHRRRRHHHLDHRRSAVQSN